MKKYHKPMISIQAPSGMTMVLPISEDCEDCMAVMDKIENHELVNFKVFNEVINHETGEEIWHIKEE